MDLIAFLVGFLVGCLLARWVSAVISSLPEKKAEKPNRPDTGTTQRF